MRPHRRGRSHRRSAACHGKAPPPASASDRRFLQRSPEYLGRGPGPQHGKDPRAPRPWPRSSQLSPPAAVGRGATQGPPPRLLRPVAPLDHTCRVDGQPGIAPWPDRRSRLPCRLVQEEPVNPPRHRRVGGGGNPWQGAGPPPSRSSAFMPPTTTVFTLGGGAARPLGPRHKPAAPQHASAASGCCRPVTGRRGSATPAAGTPCHWPSEGVSRLTARPAMAATANSEVPSSTGSARRTSAPVGGALHVSAVVAWMATARLVLARSGHHLHLFASARASSISCSSEIYSCRDDRVARGRNGLGSSIVGTKLVSRKSERERL